MGKAKSRRDAFLHGRRCIFCGGNEPATTVEHCPARSMFDGRSWPEGYEFPACATCNRGSADDDLIAALLAHMDPTTATPDRLEAGRRLLWRLMKVEPEMVREMFSKSPIEARTVARRLGMKRAKGQSFQELPVINVPDRVREAIGVLARKLSKALYYMQTGNIFPPTGGIVFTWFTNAQKIEHGKIPALDALAGLAKMSPPVRRNGIDLRDQFDHYYSTDDTHVWHVLQVTFGRVFGFVTFMCTDSDALEAMMERARATVPDGSDPFTWLASAPKAHPAT